MARPDFWQDSEGAQRISRRLGDLQADLELWRSIEKKATQYLDLPEDSLENFRAEIEDFIAGFQQARIRLFLSGKHDLGNALVYIYAGAGGDDAQDWARMLLRMYQRYAQIKDFEVSLIEKSENDQGGIKSALLEVKAPLAYGLLKGESGVHRLVRLSPFSAKQLRHTSFALVEVMPQVSAKSVIIDPKDLKIETFRSSGPGGQNMQKTESAVRITHLPTGLTAEVQSERSQLQNKERALSVLASRLTRLLELQKAKEFSELKTSLGPGGIEWGSQIRSYVLHPYKSVKDHRTELESHDPEAVLDGQIDVFIEAELMHD